MTAPRRRWFAFRLRTLFALLTVACLWLGWQVQIVHERKAILSKLGGRESVYIDRLWPPEVVATFANEIPYVDPPDIPFWRKWLGDRSIGFILLPDVGLATPDGAFTAEEIDRIKSAFPESDVECYQELWTGRSFLERPATIPRLLD